MVPVRGSDALWGLLTQGMGMRVIIAGSRHLGKEFYPRLLSAIESSGFEITTVLSGGARGADALGETWAIGMGIPLEIFPAAWDESGKRAGPMRNAKMADNADALILLWDGESRGSADMLRRAEKKRLKIFQAIV